MVLVLDGKACSKAIEEELATFVPSLAVAPKVALLLVGNDSGSKTYVKLKKNACTRVGITADIHEIDGAVTFEDLDALIQQLNVDASVHGILLQLPLPVHLQAKEETLLESIRPEKDIDGLHSEHFFQLAKPTAAETAHATSLHLEPCTPAGCVELLARNGIDVAGKDVVMVGRGKLVGLPLSLMLMKRDATVTTCHSKTKGLADKVKQADIVIVGTGQPELVKGEWIKEGAVVVDVGINYVDDATSKRGYKIIGDVEYEAAKAHASAITPVPGGIGPMTIALLLKNIVKCAEFVQPK
ncbi:Bifunctional fold protein, partial [Globisporangium splendens]